jgi:hypothetical protein
MTAIMVIRGFQVLKVWMVVRGQGKMLGVNGIGARIRA